MPMMAAYRKPPTSVDVGGELAAMFRRRQITQQDAAYQMGIRDDALSRGIQGTGPLDAWALSRLSTLDFIDLFRSLVFAKVGADADAILASRKVMAKAELRDKRDEKVGA